ncbi:hypothetical protein, partial [Halorubrum sp. SS7]|uniref:hypothetical protein n=1 Tax=Halorubrum sp. SS7 TaxID=2518119 RepID=UPI001A7E1B08
PGWGFGGLLRRSVSSDLYVSGWGFGGVHRRSTDDYLSLLKSYSPDRFCLKRLVAEECEWSKPEWVK